MDKKHFRSGPQDDLYDRIDRKLAQVEAEAQVLRAILHGTDGERRASSQDRSGNKTPPTVAKTRGKSNLKEVVWDVLANAPDHKLTRPQIVEQVRARLGQKVKHIGVVSTLAARDTFKALSGGVYTLVDA